MTDLQTVLCIEDDDTIRLLISEELQFAGYRVLQARDGVEGLALLRTHRPDLVVCDVSMPQMNGMELLESVSRYETEIAQTPFIMLTAQADRDHQIRGRQLGVDDYLIKPVDFDLLLAAVAAHIRRQGAPATIDGYGASLQGRSRLVDRLEAGRRVISPQVVTLIKLDAYMALSVRLPGSELQQLLQEIQGRLQRMAEGAVFRWSESCWVVVDHVGIADVELQNLLQRQDALLNSLSDRHSLSILRVAVDWTSDELRRLDARALIEACALHLDFESAISPRRQIFLGKGDYQALEAARYAERNLAQAIRGGELELVFQPRVELGNGRIVGAEALLRWPGTALGVLSPGFFVPAAERIGLATELDHWVIDRMLQAARLLLPWRRDFVLSFNLSGQSLDAGVPAYLTQLLIDAADLAPSLEIEVTETSMAHLTPDVEEAIAYLRQLGTKLAVDDFGMGYASLAYLKRLRAEVIKIDRSFVSEVADKDIDARIVEGLISLARALGCVVVAEGVESAEQAEALLNLGCRYAQGYYFYQPMALQELLLLLETT